MVLLSSLWWLLSVYIIIVDGAGVTVLFVAAAAKPIIVFTKLRQIENLVF